MHWIIAISQGKVCPTALLLLTFALQCTAANDIRLPDMGDSSDLLISAEQERRLGMAFMRHLRKNGRIVDDPLLQQYIQRIGSRIVANSDSPETEFIFFMVFDRRINAFAGPGGTIGINTGVLLNARNESELAGVIAHEVAHITQRHLARAFEQRKQYSMPYTAAMLGAIVLGARNPDVGALATMGIQGLNLQNQINFTRANEKEADRVGMQFLVRSGYDPRGMPGFFKRLLQKNRNRENVMPEFLSTHPLTLSRIADSESRADSYPLREVRNSREYELMRIRVDVFSDDTPSGAVKTYAEKIATLAESGADSELAQYGYIMALARSGKLEQATEEMQRLLDQRSDDLHYLLLAAEISAAGRQYTAAIKLFDYAQRLFGNTRPLVFSWARTLLDAGQPAEARTLLREYRQWNDNYSQDAHFFDLLAQAESQAGYPVEGTIAKTESLYLRGDTKEAIAQLHFADRNLQLNYYQEQRVIARRAELEKELAEEKKMGLR